MKIWERSTAMKAPGNDATYTVECDRDGKHYILAALSASAGHYVDPEEERNEGNGFFFFFGL